MTPTTIAIAVLAVAAFGTIVLLLGNAASQRRMGEDIPPALRPGYSDDQLESNVLERYMSWGLVLTLFFAVFLPVYWLREPARINSKATEEFVQQVVRGGELFEANCAECHGIDGGGGAAASPYGGQWPAPNLTNIVKRYEDSRTITDVQNLIETTLHRGRPGTPMPAWGSDYGGPLTDLQINDITAWILAQQVDEVAEAQPAADLSGEQLYTQNCVRCHGAELQGVVGPSLVGVFERHDEESVLGILRNGINLGNGVIMPPWQNGYLYEDTRYTDEALGKIVDYLAEQQPAELPPGAEQYQSPGLGEPDPEPPATEEPTGTAQPTEDDTAGPAPDATDAEPTATSTDV